MKLKSYGLRTFFAGVTIVTLVVGIGARNYRRTKDIDAFRSLSAQHGYGLFPEEPNWWYVGLPNSRFYPNAVVMLDLANLADHRHERPRNQEILHTIEQHCAVRQLDIGLSKRPDHLQFADFQDCITILAPRKLNFMSLQFNEDFWDDLELPAGVRNVSFSQCTFPKGRSRFFEHTAAHVTELHLDRCRSVTLAGPRVYQGMTVFCCSNSRHLQHLPRVFPNLQRCELWVDSADLPDIAAVRRLAEHGVPVRFKIRRESPDPQIAQALASLETLPGVEVTTEFPLSPQPSPPPKSSTVQAADDPFGT